MEKIIIDLKNKYNATPEFIVKLINIRLECSGNYEGIFKESFYKNNSVEYCMLLEDIEYLIISGILKENYNYAIKLLGDINAEKKYKNSFVDYIVSDFINKKIDSNKVIELFKKNNISVVESVYILESYKEVA